MYIKNNWWNRLMIRLEVCQGFNYKYSAEWDKKLNKLIDDGEITYQDDYMINFRLGRVEYSVWIGNRWYAYATNKYQMKVEDKKWTEVRESRPSIKTMIKLYNFIGRYSVDNSKWRDIGDE